MCTTGEKFDDALNQLVKLLEGRLQLPALSISSTLLLNLLTNDWDKVSTLAHAVHDSKDARLRRDAVILSGLTVEGFLNIAKNNSCPEVRDSFKRIASEAGFRC